MGVVLKLNFGGGPCKMWSIRASDVSSPSPTHPLDQAVRRKETTLMRRQDRTLDCPCVARQRQHAGYLPTGGFEAERRDAVIL